MNVIHPTGNLQDSEVIAEVMKGNANAYEIIVRRYNGYLYKIGRSYGYKHEDVQDLMQETYVNAFRNLSKFRQDASLLTWLSRIMLNNCYHKKERLSYQKEIATETVENKSLPMFNSQLPNANNTVMNDELRSILENAILHLPDTYRTVFTLRQLNGMSVRETAETMELSESNVKVRLNRAKGMLQQEIEKSYSSEEIFEFNLIYCDAMVERVMQAVRGLERV